MTTKTVKATCKVGACEPQCGMEFDITDGVISAVRPDKTHPISKGYVCKKGMAVAEYQNDPDRLLHPIKRVNNKFVNIEWDQATTEIGEKLAAIVKKYGPTSIATYWGNAADTSGMIAANTLCSGLGSPNSFNVLSLEYTDRGAVAERLFGEHTLIVQPDANKTEFALLLGTNPLVTQGMSLLQRRPNIASDLKDISKRGGKVVVVDPRVTATTKISDQHIVIRPGTDLFLLLGMLTVIVENELYNKDYIALHINGFSEWKNITAQISLARMSEITGISSNIIEVLAQEFCKAKSAFITTRVGVQTSHNTTLTEWLVQTINAVTGNIDRPGGMFFNQGAIDNTALIHKFTKRKNPARSRIGDYPQIFGGPPASVFSEDVLSDDPGRIRALVVIAGNPVMSFPNTPKIEKALEKLDLLVCIDIYKSDTGSFAHYNLPAATIYEKGGFHFLTQPFEPYPFAEWRHKLVEPRGKARPEWDIARDIAKSAKIPFLNNPLFNIIDKVLGLFGKTFTEEHLAQILLVSNMARRKIKLKTLQESSGIKMGDIVYGDFFKKYMRTPDKKINLAPHDLVVGLNKVLTKPPLPNDEFPLILISGGRRLSTFNSWTHNMPSLVDKLGENFVTLNVEDAKKYDVLEDEKIRVVTETGSLDLPAKITDEIKEGVVMIHQFWGHHYDSSQNVARKNPGYNVNHLHCDIKLDEFTGMPIYNGTRCIIEKKQIRATNI